MRKLGSGSVMSVVLLVSALGAKADTLNGNGSWQTWNPAILGTASSPAYGGPFWNALSGDGPTNNVGWCLAGGGGCSVSNPPGALPYFGNGASDVSNMWFSSGGSGVTVSLRGVFTNEMGPLGIDYLGYYTVNASGVVTSTTQLFSATAPLAASQSFAIAPNTNYGFYLENIQGQGTVNETDYWFYMDSTQDTDNRGTALTAFQHAAVFQNGSAGYYLGFEDCISNACDEDYNDVIVQMTATPTTTPEPAPLVLAGAGFIGLFLLFALRSSSQRRR